MRIILLFIACLLPRSIVLAQTALPLSQIQLTAQDLVYKTSAQYLTAHTSPMRLLNADRCSIPLPCARTSALPVKLVSFSGIRTDETHVALFWETSEEVNNDYFEIERTVNPAHGYQLVGVAKGTGSSSSIVKYQTVDPNNHTGYTYYRLKQVDFDGTFSYSSVVGIKGSIVPFQVIAFPNPGQGKDIAFQVSGLKQEEQLSVIIYDARGSVVYQDDHHPYSAEIQPMQFNLKGLPVGKYSMKLKGRLDETATSFVISP